METILQFIISLVLGGVAFMLIARFIPNIELRGGFTSAMLVALVYGLLKALLQGILILFTLPAVILTLGLFIFVINAFLLWLTDKLMVRFEIRTKGALLLGTLALAVIDLAFQSLLRTGIFG